MASANIPEIINDFNTYSKGNRFIGISGAVNLPNFDAVSEEIAGAGILGSYNTSAPGAYGPMTQELTFRVLDDDIFSAMNPLDPVDLTFRASEQSTVKGTAEITNRGIRVVERGRFMSFQPGNLDKGKKMDAKVIFEVMYILIEVDGVKKVEYDKLNDVFIMNNRDVLEKVRELT